MLEPDPKEALIRLILNVPPRLDESPGHSVADSNDQAGRWRQPWREVAKSADDALFQSIASRGSDQSLMELNVWMQKQCALV